MSYFSEHYCDLAYTIAGAQPGLYNAQIGAIHSIAAHFTLRDEPAVITMPTGSGKTAVLMMAPFVLRSNRALVVTPSVMVRDQIREDLETLATLKGAGVLPSDIPLPKVHEVRERLQTVADWEALAEFDIVVTTPNCASPGYEAIPAPPDDLFDLLLIDEAHHSPASTWANLLEALGKARRILFTATPFRRDRAEIAGRFIYTYSVSRAHADKIFGKIRYVPVETDNAADIDATVARKAESVLAEDRKAGFNHFLMVRTDRRTRAEELAKIYASETKLDLQVIHSGHSSRRAKKIIGLLKKGQLDGIICVNMLGEGFNFPNLKIAAIHAPHRSLEVTLQFIGRFARTNSPDIGEAKFIAAPNDIEIEGQRLFSEDAVWQDIIVGLSQGKIAEELNIREVLQEFDLKSAADPELKDLSLYSLYPRTHVKIFDVSEVGHIDLARPIRLPGRFQICYRAVNESGNVVTIVAQELGQPRWSDGDRLLNTTYDLIIVYVDVNHGLLFVNTSRSIDGLYQALRNTLAPGATVLPTCELKRVVRGLKNQKIFNIGMRNIRAANNAESYRILAGSNTQAAVKPSDGRLYRQGHVFMTGEENGERTTIGYSSGSKVWAAASLQIPLLIDWCNAIGVKVRATDEILTNSGLDYLSAGAVVTEIPKDIIFAQWDKTAFDYDLPVQVRYASGGGATRQCHISDLDLVVESDKTDRNAIRLIVRGEDLEYPIEFSLADFYAAVDDEESVTVIRGQHTSTLVEYLNDSPLDFFTGEGALFKGNELFEPRVDAMPLDGRQVVAADWTGVDITEETAAKGGCESIHRRVESRLASIDCEVILYDHRTGETADFVTLGRQGPMFVVGLYHCKGSREQRPGARVEDVYEVCGQAEKSVVWTQSLSRLLKKIESRQGKSRFIKGSMDDVRRLFVDAKMMGKRFEITVVQPGLLRTGVLTSKGIVEKLSATNDHLVAAGCEKLTVWTS